MIKLLLVDDHELVRTGIKHILNSARGLRVVGEAPDGETAVKLCRKEAPDIVLMDMNMPGMGGLEATKKIKRYCPNTRIIILSVCSKAPLPNKVMKAGAYGYLTKGMEPQAMIAAVRQVASGERCISPDIAQQMALNQVSCDDMQAILDLLSERELQVMMMIVRGRNASDIAAELTLSNKTVNTYRYRLFLKLNVSNDVELTHLAIRYGLLDLDELDE